MPIVRPLMDCSALLVGATSGMGLEIAAQLAEAGVPRIAIVGRDADRGRAACDRVTGRAPMSQIEFLPADAARRDAVEAVVAAAAERFGGLDLLVNAVPGTVPPVPFEASDPADYAPLIACHLHAVLYATRAALPHLIARGGGVILTIASDAAKIPTPGESVHGALMAALDMFSRTLALESARHGIRVHTLTPSLVADTIGFERMMAAPFSRKLFEKAAGRAALGLPVPADIARLAVFLASPAAARITGQSITVNGGLAIA